MVVWLRKKKMGMAYGGMAKKQHNNMAHGGVA